MAVYLDLHSLHFALKGGMTQPSHEPEQELVDITQAMTSLAQVCGKPRFAAKFAYAPWSSLGVYRPTLQRLDFTPVSVGGELAETLPDFLEDVSRDCLEQVADTVVIMGGRPGEAYAPLLHSMRGKGLKVIGIGLRGTTGESNTSWAGAHELGFYEDMVSAAHRLPAPLAARQDPRHAAVPSPPQNSTPPHSANTSFLANMFIQPPDPCRSQNTSSYFETSPQSVSHNPHLSTHPLVPTKQTLPRAFEALRAHPNTFEGGLTGPPAYTEAAAGNHPVSSSSESNSVKLESFSGPFSTMHVREPQSECLTRNDTSRRTQTTPPGSTQGPSNSSRSSNSGSNSNNKNNIGSKNQTAAATPIQSNSPSTGHEVSCVLGETVPELRSTFVPDNATSSQRRRSSSSSSSNSSSSTLHPFSKKSKRYISAIEDLDAQMVSAEEEIFLRHCYCYDYYYYCYLY
jgi:hypothetical protein